VSSFDNAIATWRGRVIERLRRFDNRSATRILKYSATVFWMFSIVTSRSCNASRSFSASFAKSSVIGRPVNCEFAITRRSAPSSSRTLERMRLATKNATSSGNSTLAALALLIRIATHVSSSGGSIAHREAPAEAGLQALFEALHFLRITVTGEDHLLLPFEQRVERVEELFLRTFLAGEELDVVDQQRVERAIRGLEVVDRVVLQGAHHVAHEALGVHVGNPRVLVLRADVVADGVHQVRLAEADTAVDEQRVVGPSRVRGDLHRCGAGELVALALDEIGEREICVQATADLRQCRLATTAGFGRPDGPVRHR